MDPLKLKVEAKVLQSVVDHIGPHKIRPRDSTQDIKPICARIFTFLGQHAIQVGRTEPDMDFVREVEPEATPAQAERLLHQVHSEWMAEQHAVYIAIMVAG